MKKQRILLFLLAVCTGLSLLAGCGSKSAPTGDGSKPKQTDEAAVPRDGEVAAVGEIIVDLTQQVRDSKAKYPDTVGWLQIPGTSINDVVVCRPGDNAYYMRNNLDGVYDFNGVYYADSRSTFGDGTRAELGLNTCIYGHAMTDNPDREQYTIRFGPLHDYRNPEYAKTMPYILFATEEETLAFEVFAVFTGNGDNPALPYNRNDIPAEEFLAMIENEVLPRSLYHYDDVSFSEDDRFLTLSTCIYTLPDGTRLNYETSEMRYAVMAKLVDPGHPLKAKASFVENKELRIDPDGLWPR